MRIEINANLCDGCGCCVAICPYLAIENREYSVTINPDKCTGCQICIKSCPVGAIINVAE